MAKYKTKIKDGQLIVRVKLSYEEKVNERDFSYFTEKNINYFLEGRIIRSKVIKYTGPYGISLFERMKEPISKHNFFFLIEQIVAAVQELQNYNLPVNNMIFDIKNIYINKATQMLQFIYLPIGNNQDVKDIIQFMEMLTYSVIPEQNQSVDCFTKFVYYLKSLPEFDIGMVEKYILEEEKSVVKMIKGYSAEEAASLSGRLKDSVDMDEEATELFYDEDEATCFMDEECTVLLEEPEQSPIPTLHRVSTNETICIVKPVFRIGKERSDVDYTVVNNAAVSRSHAKILVKGKRYFVVDLGSKNRTFINNQAIPEQQEMEVFDKDSIKFANEEFIFNC